MTVIQNPPALVIRHRRSWLIALVSILLAAAVIGGLKEASRTTSVTDRLPDGFDSTRVAEALQSFPRAPGSNVVVLYTADTGTLSPQTLQALRATSVAPNSAPLVASKDGTAALRVVPVAAVGNTEIAGAVKAIRATARHSAPPGVSAQVTGPAAIQADLGAVFEGANTRLLVATATVVAVLLLITYRSPILWIVPLVVVGLADRLAAVVATQVLSRTGVPWDESTIGILSVLVFGAGTDYALLLISRYRDELRREPDRYEAMRQALRRSGEAILLSATTVVLGVLTLLLSGQPLTRGLGLASAVGIIVAATCSLVVLPATLVLFPRWVFWPLIPRMGQSALTEAGSFWRRIGQRVAARPSVVAGGCLAVLAVMAAGVPQVQTGLSETDQFLSQPEGITASQRLARSFPAGSSDPVLVITAGDPAAVIRAVQSVPAVASARPGARHNGLSQVSVVLTAEPGSEAAGNTINDLRSALDSVPGTYVGGTEARAVDSAAAASRDRLLILPLILGLVLASLILLLRSLVAPIILVVTVVATFLASLGASWWLFTGPLGFSALDVDVPLLTFLFLVALGVDYNIFLVTRAREEALIHGVRQGMLRALAATGGVITSAGVLLAAVFAVLGVLPLVALAQVGTVICVGVLLDTLLVRTLLVPALALVLGDRFWWPRRFSTQEVRP